jgi:hypothetical protein
LHEIADAPWRHYYARGLDEKDLASLLHHYRIAPTTVRGLDELGKPTVAKGYKIEWFRDVWDRYLDEEKETQQ